MTELKEAFLGCVLCFNFCNRSPGQHLWMFTRNFVNPLQKCKGNYGANHHKINVTLSIGSELSRKHTLFIMNQMNRDTFRVDVSFCNCLIVIVLSLYFSCYSALLSSSLITVG